MENSKFNIMIIDDKKDNLRLLSQILQRDEYKIRPVNSGKTALLAAAEEKPDLVLLDIMMPEMDGFEVARNFKEDIRLKNVPIIFLSALSDIENIIRSFDEGGIDYITKPFFSEEVKKRVETQLRLVEMRKKLEDANKNLSIKVYEQIKEITDAQLAIIFALAKLAEYRDDDTGKHLIRVRKICRILAQHLRQKEKYKDQIDDEFIENIYTVSPLHDIGKVGIPDNILLKPGKLTPEEFEIMKTHTELGSKAIKDVAQEYKSNNLLKMGCAVAKHHHERWDGNGYPEGVKGEEIPLCARIVAVADVYDALRTKRVYKEPFSHEKSRDIIINSSGGHFDPGIIEVFLEVEDKIIEISEVYSD